MQGHKNEINCLVALADGCVLSGGKDTNLKLWDLTTARCRRTFEGHTHEVLCAAELNNGNLTSGALDKSIIVWERKTGLILNTLEGFEQPVILVMELPDMRISLSCGEKYILVWEWQSELDDNLVAFEEHDGNVLDMCVMRESILTASSDKSVRKWSIDEETCEGTFNGHKGSVFKITQMDANLFATAASDHVVKVWDFTTLECTRSLATHTSAISSVMFIEGEGLLVSTSLDGTIAVWSPYYGSQPLQRKINQEAPVKHAIYLGKMVLSLRDLA